MTTEQKFYVITALLLLWDRCYKILILFSDDSELAEYKHTTLLKYNRSLLHMINDDENYSNTFSFWVMTLVLFVKLIEWNEIKINFST